MTDPSSSRPGSPSSHRGVRSLLVATALLFVATILAMGGTGLWLRYATVLERARTGTQDLARILEEHAGHLLGMGDLILEDALERIEARGGIEGLRADPYQAYRLASELARRAPLDGYVLITGPDGIPIALSHRYPAPTASLADRQWWKAHAEDGAERHVGEAILSRLTHETLFTYSRRIVDDRGEMAGVVQLALRPSFFQDAALTGGLDGTAVLGMFGNDGRIIARTNLPRELIGRSIGDTPLFTTHRDERTGTYRGPSAFDGSDRIISFRRLDRWPVVVAASVPMPVVIAPWYREFWLGLGAIGLVLAALGWLTWMGTRLSDRLHRANDELAAALAGKEVLFKEVHHRVKNNLQITGSLLQMQARRFADREVREAFQETRERLNSIGMVHDTLYRTDASGRVGLSQYIGGLVSGLSSTYGASQRGIVVDLDLDPVEVDQRDAVPIALIVTELVSNAFKHGFGPGREGRILVSAKRVADALEVTVRDTGTGYVHGSPSSTPHPGSLGLTLVRALAAQLQATFSLEGGEGTTARLTIPESRAGTA